MILALAASAACKRGITAAESTGHGGQPQAAGQAIGADPAIDAGASKQDDPPATDPQITGVAADTTSIQPVVADTTAPVPGNAGAVNLLANAASITVRWTPATDNATTAAKLAYRVYYSADDNVATLGHIVSSGAASVAAGSSSVTLVGLQPSSKYYVNVLVQDELGNQAAYAGADVTTTVPGPTCTDGGVVATAADENHVYIGGRFTRAGPCLTRGAVLSRASAQLSIPIAGYAAANGAIRAAAPDGSGGWYIGGDFSKVGQVTRNCLAHINADGSLDLSWNPDVNNSVYALAVSGSTVYFGGVFDTVGGQARGYIAAVGVDGTLSAWDPGMDSEVYTLVAAGSVVYAGGNFTAVGAAARNYIAAIDAASGLATSWDPSANNEVDALALSGALVYAGGQFTTIGGATRKRLAALAADGTATAWNPAVNNSSVYALAVAGPPGAATVYAGGTFTDVGTGGSHVTRNRLAAFPDSVPAAATAWNPNANGQVSTIAVVGSTAYVGGTFTKVGAQASDRNRRNIAALDGAGNATSWAPEANGWVLALVPNGPDIYVGGDYEFVGGLKRNNLASIDDSGSLTSWNPGADDSVRTLAAASGLIYAGGDFNKVGALVRSRLAAIDAATGIANDWNPSADRSVNVLVVADNIVYAGGFFDAINGQTRHKIAAIDAGATGALTSWYPALSAGDGVANIALLGPHIYLAGNFNAIAGQTRENFAAVTRDGSVAAWNPNFAGGDVANFVVVDSKLFVGGGFSAIDGVTRDRLAAFTSDGTLTPWNPGTDALTFSVMATDGEKIYIGGMFSHVGGQSRNGLAAITSGGAVTNWNPDPSPGATISSVRAANGHMYVGGLFSGIGGATRANLGVLNSDDGQAL